MAYAKLEELRDEKKYLMKDWYDRHNVPQVERESLFFFEQREDKRRQAREVALEAVVAAAKQLDEEHRASPLRRGSSVRAALSGSQQGSASPEPQEAAAPVGATMFPNKGESQHHGKRISLNKLVGLQVRRDQQRQQSLSQESTFGQLWATRHLI